MTPAQILALMAVIALALAVAGVRGGWLKMPKRRVKYDDLDAQIAADYPPEHRAEARGIIDDVLSHAEAEQHSRVWRSLLDGTRGDIAHLRRVRPKAIESLAKLYRVFGGGPGSPSAPPSTD